MTNLSFDEDQAIARLMRFLAVEGITGQEEAIGQDVVKALIEAGVSKKYIHFDKANEHIPLPTQTGNLVVMLPGTMNAPRRLFMTHLDTVPLGAGAVPVRKGKRIVPAGKTALGGDNRTGVACLVSMIATLLERGLPHPPLTVLFTVREESGLWGARFVDADELGRPSLGFNVDGRSPEDFTIGAVGAERWQVEIRGRAAHAGVHPEQGISSTVVASLALAEAHKQGWFGKINKNGKEGTSNVGSVGDQHGKSAGEATNVVTDYVLIKGEARSHDAGFVREITAAYRQAFRHAAGQVRDHRGRHAKIRFQSRRDYYPFRLKETSPVVRLGLAAGERAGWHANLRVTNGGLDANWLVRHGIPTITFGAGQNEIHTVDEYVEIPEFLRACRLALALATQE
ncbi:MAG TPA: M20/M25/M40 family metallo-hydrolase [Gemmataceae bacterium]|nr:M20/M25/M40 family metallo-hydrolase [Gemmataceae bacterium]